MWLLSLVFAVCTVLVTRVLWRRWKYDMHKIPAPPAVPFLGHVLAILKDGDITRYRGHWWKKLGYPKMMKLNLAGRDMIVVTDLEYLKSVVMSKTKPFPKSNMLKAGLAPMLGNKLSAKCMLNTFEPTPYVKAMRKVYATGFQSNILKAAVPRVHDVLDKMIEIIDHRRSTDAAVDVQALCVKVTLDIIGVVAFDKTLGGLDGSSALYQGIIDVGHYLSTQSLNPFRALYTKLFPSSKVARKYRAALEQLTAEYDKLTKEIIAREDATGEEGPIWSGLKRFIDPETGAPLLYDSFLTEVALVVMSGMDTTGHQLAWILALLGSNPDKADKLVEELKDRGLSGENARNATFSDLGELPYLTAVIKEGMRIAHSVFGPFIRSVPRDMTILGYRVPAGTVVIFPSPRLMCSEAEWGDPDVFRPERWLSGEDMSQKLYLGFSYGPRDCIGQRLAMMEMRMALIRLVSKYKFSLTVPFDDLMNNVSNGVAIESKDGVWLNIAERDHAIQVTS